MNSPLTRSLLVLVLFCFAWATPARAQNPMLELVTSAVQQPIYITNAGGQDDRLFIVERAGRIRIIDDNGVLLPTPFLDISSLVDTSGEGGLLSIAFHPDYSNDPNDSPVHRVFVSYTGAGTGGSALTSVIARYDLSGNPDVLDPASGKILLTVAQPQTNHNGGQIQFNTLNGLLYIAFGDGGSPGTEQCPAQRIDGELGKMLRIDVDLAVDAAPWYEVPTTNPFYDPPDPNDPNNPGDGVLDTIWSAGFRNPWRFSFDRSTHDMWIGDVGEQEIEEVDFEFSTSVGGRNYGWSVKEGTMCLTNNPSSIGCPPTTPRCSSNSYIDPVFEYEHPNSGGAAITGGYVYRGGRANSFVGRYIFGDSQLGEIYALKPGILNFESDVLSTGDLQQPVSFGEDSNGELYVADIATNSVYRLRLDLVVLTGDFKCITKMNAQSAKFANTVEKELSKCVTKMSRAKIPPVTSNECLVPQPLELIPPIQKGIVAVSKVDDKYCESDVPPFGYAPYPVVFDATLDASYALLDDVFGDIAESISTNKEIGKCQSDVLKGLDKCQRARQNEFNSCKKQKVKNDTLLVAADVEACIGADPKGKVAKTCAPAQSKLALKTIPKSCVEKGVDLAAAFPGCGTADAGELAECIDAAGRCRDCQLISGIDALGLDCALACPAP